MSYSFLDDLTVQNIDDLDPLQFRPGTIARCSVQLATDGIGQPIHVPVIVARGALGSEVLGCTAVVHGNELNGIPVIQELFQQIDVNSLHGIIVGVPIVNIPSILRRQRQFIDGKDLNHIMPGRQDGDASEVYAYRLVHKIIRHFTYLIDLHTASVGRINSYYIRADMDKAETAMMATLQNAQIIVHNPPRDGTLRGAADALGIPAITLEVGDPSTFQRGMIRSSLTGIHNLLHHLEFTDGVIEKSASPAVVCRSSYWIYTDTGGILRVLPSIVEYVQKGQLIATISNIYGDTIKEYYAPEDGIVVGKSVNPICPTGGRILHLGLCENVRPDSYRVRV